MVKKVIAVYPGRFQPMGKHHAATFKWLQDKFGKENTYIVTSDKVEMPKSPLNFEEKKLVASKYGFGDSIVKVKNPYKAEEVTSKYDPETTAIVFMVGKKDMEDDPRFKIGLKKDGTPGYFKRYEPGKPMEPFTKHGYLIVAPHVSLKTPDGQEMSGTSIRSALSNPKSTPEEFKQIFGWYDPKIESMIKSKFKMKESIEQYRLLEQKAVDAFFVARLLIKEGGNAIPTSIPVDKADIRDVVKSAIEALPKELRNKVEINIGSAGFKAQSGDIDIFVDEDAVVEYFKAKDAKDAKKKMESYFVSKGFESRVSGRNVHIGIPYKDAKAQVDVMVIKDASLVAPWHQHGLRGAYADPDFKGAYVNILISSIAKYLGLKFDAFGAKLIRRDNEEVVARDRDRVAKILLNPKATGDDLNSVKSILKALENDPKREEKLAQAKDDEKKGLIKLTYNEGLLKEAEGARIQHPEDLIYWEGSKGAKSALSALQNIDPKSVSVKWDGSPAVVFGYDEKGDFIFTDKNAYVAKGYDGKTKSAEDLQKMIVDRGARSGKDYSEFGSAMASVFDAAKNSIPKKKGLYKGDMLYLKTPEKKGDNYVFKPNVVTYQIPANTELGKKIGKSKAGVVVHSFETPDGKSEDVSSIKFNPNSGFLVVPPVISSEAPTIDKAALSKASSAVSAASIVDKLLKKDTLISMKMSDLPEVLYNYTNNRVENINKLSANDFSSFINTNAKISETKKQKILAYVSENKDNFDKMFNAVKAIAELKNSIIDQFDSKSGEVKASIGDQPGGEGYVIKSPVGLIKLVNRGGFTAANRAIQR